MTTTEVKTTADPRLTGRRVLVTGAGGPAGVAVAREVARLGAVPVVVDGDPLAVGLHLGFEAGTVPVAAAPDYPEQLLRLAADRRCAAVVPTVGEELLRLAGREQEFAERGVAAWFPSVGTVADCLDKWAFAGRVEAAGVAAPRTRLGGPDELPGPWVIKPRWGRGSRDVHLVDDPEDFPTLLRRVPEPVVQTRLSGREFTADCLIDRQGALLGAVPRWRAQVRGGISTLGTTFADARVDVLVKELASALELTGPCNVQGFLDPGDCAPARVVEVNPRYAGGLPLSLAAGADLVGQYLLGLLGHPMDAGALVGRSDVTTARSFAEHPVGSPVGSPLREDQQVPTHR